MMSQMNYTDSSTPSSAKATRFPLLRMLLASLMLLLLGSSHQAMAAPGPSGKEDCKPALPNYQLANGSAQDIVTVTISPIPSPSQGITFVINGGLGGDPVIPTDAFGNATLPLTSPMVTSYPVTAEIVDPVTFAVTIIWYRNCSQLYRCSRTCRLVQELYTSDTKSGQCRRSGPGRRASRFV